MLGRTALFFCGRKIKKIRLQTEDIFYFIIVIEKILSYEISDIVCSASVCFNAAYWF